MVLRIAFVVVVLAGCADDGGDLSEGSRTATAPTAPTTAVSGPADWSAATLSSATVAGDDQGGLGVAANGDAIIEFTNDDGARLAAITPEMSIRWERPMSYAVGSVIDDTIVLVVHDLPAPTGVVADNDSARPFTGLVALDAADGEERWRIPMAASDQPSLAAADGAVVVVYDNLDRASRPAEPRDVVAYDLVDGDVRWAIEEPRAQRALGTAGGSVAIALDPMSESAEVDIVALAADDGIERWRHRVAAPAAAATTVGEDVVVVAGSVLDAVTGVERFPLDMLAVRAICGGMVIGDADQRVVRAVDLSTGEEIWSYNAGNRSKALCVDEGVYLLMPGFDQPQEMFVVGGDPLDTLATVSIPGEVTPIGSTTELVWLRTDVGIHALRRPS